MKYNIFYKEQNSPLKPAFLTNDGEDMAEFPVVTIKNVPYGAQALLRHGITLFSYDAAAVEWGATQLYNITFINSAIRRAREKAGLTQQEVADALGVKYTYIQKWEYGICKPNVKNILALAVLFGTTPDSLL